MSLTVTSLHGGGSQAGGSVRTVTVQPVGPNVVSPATATGFAGVLCGDGKSVNVAVLNGLTFAPLTRTLTSAGGAANYTHTQGSASAIWTVNHNLGTRPTIEVRNAGGQVVIAEIAHVSANQATISFASAQGGTAFCTI